MILYSVEIKKHPYSSWHRPLCITNVRHKTMVGGYVACLKSFINLIHAYRVIKHTPSAVYGEFIDEVIEEGIIT